MAERDLFQARGGGSLQLRVVLERGVVEGEAALGFGDAERDGHERLRHRPQVLPVVRAEPPLGRLLSPAVHMHAVELHTVVLGRLDQAVDQLAHAAEPTLPA